MALLLAAGMMLALMVPAGAEVMTLGVYFRGLVEKEDGTVEQIPLEGSFLVLQGGLEKGIIRAGETVLSLDGSDPVSVMPMPETIDGGWDLTQAGTTVAMADGMNVTVPVLVRKLTENTVAAVPEIPAAPTAVPVSFAQSVSTAAPEETAGQAEPQKNEAGSRTAAAEPTATPEWQMTPVPTPEATPAPQVELLAETADTGSFHIKVFYDSNSNGDCSVYENGVEGVAVYLVDESGRAVTGGKTDREGEITLPGLTPGSYRIRAALSEEWGFNRKSKDIGLNKSVMDFSAEGIQESEPIRVSAGETVERGVGLLKGVVVDGVCWLDANADGIMDPHEPKVAGARVTLSGQKNGLEFEAYSDENGYWRVYRLRAGYYDFTSYVPDGLMFTRYSKTGGKNRSVFTTEGRTKATRTLDLNDGRNDLDQNIGFTWAGSVSGMVFLDANYNGMYDEGEKPMPGVKVTAIKQNKDEEMAVSFSGDDGRYRLTGLRGSTYRIRAVLPDDGSNFTVTVDDPLGNHFTARDNRRENFWKDFVLQDGEQRTVNVGAIYYGSVSGTVYMDDDFSGSQGGGEKTAQGIEVTLLDGAGRAVDTTRTSAKGTYSFTGLTPGNYSLRMTAKSGYAFSRRGEGNVMLNLNGGEGYSETFEVPLGESVTGMNAGMIMPGTVKGMVFADRNDNGRRDAGENGLTGTVVRLMSEEGEAFSATLGDSGEFLFDAVMPGRYCLEYQLPEDGIFARAGGDNTIQGEGSLGRGEWFDFKTADRREAPLCGGLTLGRISGFFFHDPDGSGTAEEGEQPMAGLRLVLTPSREDLEAAEAVSGEDGSFEMKGLHPDTYRLSLMLPEGMTLARTPGVTLPLRAGLGIQETELQVAMGQSWTNQRIGGVVPGVLRGRAWLDENNDGRQDDWEETPEGLTVKILDESTGELFATLATDAQGVFEHPGMVPGSYAVSFETDESTDAPREGESTFRREGNRLVMTGIGMTEGSLREDLHLGMVKYTALGGVVWIDRGAGAEPLAGARVTLLDGGDTPLQSQDTGENGSWRFSGLMPGDYRIQADLPEGVVAAEPDDERLDNGLISVSVETEGRRARSDLLDVRMGRDQLSLNMGSVLPGTIGDYCWLDENGNGWQDGGEYGIPHVKVELIRNGTAVAETETDQYGLYFFREVYPATYTLRATAPAEVKPTQKRTDIYLIVSALKETEDAEAYTEPFTVASDSTNFNIDLGYVLRRKGSYPAGYGEQETMDWSKAYENVTFK